MTATEKIKAIQALLGFAGAQVDGIFGPKSNNALLALDAAARREKAVSIPAESLADERSEEQIATLHPKLQPIARSLLRLALFNRMLFKITSGTRSFALQAELYKKWQAGEGGKAAPAGFSNHNYGLAFDVTEFMSDGKTPIYESANYAKLGALGASLGLYWGGAFGDEPHYELRPPWAEHMKEHEMIAELHRRDDNGIDAFA